MIVSAIWLDIGFSIKCIGGFVSSTKMVLMSTVGVMSVGDVSTPVDVVPVGL